jgi:hypothetical protein
VKSPSIGVDALKEVTIKSTALRDVISCSLYNFTDVSEEGATVIFRFEKWLMKANKSLFAASLLPSTLKIEAVPSSETSVKFYPTTGIISQNIALYA